MWETQAVLLTGTASPELGVHSVTTDYSLFFFSTQPSVPQQFTQYFRAISERHTVPLFPVSGHGDILQGVAQASHDVAGSFQSQSLEMGKGDLGCKALDPVFRPTSCHPQFTCLVHEAPGYRGPLLPQQAEGGGQPRIITQLISGSSHCHQNARIYLPSKCGYIQGGELKHFLVLLGTRGKNSP